MPPYVDPQRERFAQFGFAIGTVRGYRAWRLTDATDASGPRLAGVHHKQIWKPGENRAECRRVSYSRQYYETLQTAGMEPLQAVLRDEFGEVIWSEDGNAFPVEGHLRECQCGFYGFFEGSNDYHEPNWDIGRYDKGPVGGMIEGYGQTLIGSRGFRCTKARIVALLLGDIPTPTRDALEETYRMPIFDSFDRMVGEIGCDDGGAKAAAAAAEAAAAATEADDWMKEAARRAARDLMGDV